MMSGTCGAEELERISEEMKWRALERKQFCDENQEMRLLNELRTRIEFVSRAESDMYQNEIECIEDRLTPERRGERQQNQDKILDIQEHRAPTVILDIEKLPACPAKTQCPECRGFITTETVTSVSSLNWLICAITAMIGCVAGCCLVPLCMDRFKKVTHMCPKCQTSIHTVKRL
ncbi:cell death-inducing p53-target protein 1-like [Lampris incognitus]|uniref:cell death-inducing p53-target protein 1-like n=1 Tax=Lampris incognitus TaxID=2546036 RepID=UPI0024B4B347|nr:cell death-inducing p53-target protein 1-like [Lampris incognitus]